MAHRPPRILIVDDEPDVLTVLRLGLEADGFEVVTASNGVDGLEQARLARPDLVTLDLMMPRMDGYKVCRTLRADPRFRDVPVMIVSARNGETDRRLALELGADDYVALPCVLHEFVARVRALLAARDTARDALG